MPLPVVLDPRLEVRLRARAEAEARAVEDLVAEAVALYLDGDDDAAVLDARLAAHATDGGVPHAAVKAWLANWTDRKIPPAPSG